jgi:hypothetical protein
MNLKDRTTKVTERGETNQLKKKKKKS